MAFEQLARTYLLDFQKSCSASWGAGVKSVEMATRPVVHQFICDIVGLSKNELSEVAIHHDINFTRRERPDWRIEDEDTFGIFCFGDHKNLSLGKSFRLTNSEQSQIKRYLAFGRPVFVFDGIEFLFFSPATGKFDRISLVDKSKTDISSDWSKLPINSSVQTRFKNILENPGYRKWAEQELIEQLALRCRAISDDFAILLDAPLGSGMSVSEEALLGALHDLKSIIVSHHDSSLRNNQACADFIAQVLTFGLFYAHTRYASSGIDPEERSKKIRAFWKISAGDQFARKLRPFKAIVDSLSAPLKEENALSDWYSEILGVLAHAEYMGTSKGPQDFHSLFECFLEVFDEKTKFDRGAFYTPKELSNWLVLAAEEISVSSLGASIPSFAANVIDPCCGTGSFLEAVRALFDGIGLEGHQLTGFEILPAPYALSHYRLSQIYSNTELDNVSVLLTDTLSDSIHKLPASPVDEFAKEKEAAALSCQSELRLVIGNPPSSNHPIQSSQRSIIEGLMKDFRPPKEERSDRQNIQKALSNEAYRFLRWGGERVIEAEKGILALVLPGAFTEAISFKYARKWLIDNFKDIYVIKIDEDARRGSATQSLFNVLQGRMALVATYDKSDHSLACIQFSSIADMSLSDKKAFLDVKPDIANFEKVEPCEPNWIFAPKPSYPEDLWSKCIPLSNGAGAAIFKSKCSAIKLAPSSTLFHTQKPTMIRRSSELSGKLRTLSTPRAIEKWFAGQRRPPKEEKFTHEVKAALSKINPKTDIKEYLFRPFTSGWVIENEDLFAALSAAPGGGTRARPEIRKAFSDHAIGIAVAPAPADLGATLTRFACFCWNLPDNDIAARGNAMIYCNVFPEKEKTGLGSSKSNIDDRFLKHFKFSTNPDLQATYYVYAVLSSSEYLDSFEGVLYRSSDPSNPPRVPLAASEQVRSYLSDLGKQIAACEKPDYDVKMLKSLQVEFPGKKKALQLAKSSFDESTETLFLTSKAGETIQIQGVPPSVVNLTIAGHNILDKWIRERKFSYLRRDFSHDDINQLLKLISTIEVQLRLIEKVDQTLSTILSNDDLITI